MKCNLGYGSTYLLNVLYKEIRLFKGLLLFKGTINELLNDYLKSTQRFVQKCYNVTYTADIIDKSCPELYKRRKVEAQKDSGLTHILQLIVIIQY